MSFKDMKNCLPSSYNHNIDTIKDICKKATFPNIFQLLQVALTMPVSSATRERSFSSMRRLKNWLRAKILEKYSTKKRKLLLVYIPFKLCYYYYHLNNYILHLIVDWNDYNNYKIVFGGIWDLCPLHNFSTPSVWPLVAPMLCCSAVQQTVPDQNHFFVCSDYPDLDYVANS
ncbi:hypothetical protein AGLY_010004 [Aphis glycines]|uniref:HAT C-terminal dimerisation domain-containing protein n=1 Tax=Aphis glycines TaxID=307491 RepID=A0A6G0TG81_APHGL|nr:hypothetical protein AGLY_010004 [Aphis glycines]